MTRLLYGLLVGILCILLFMLFYQEQRLPQETLRIVCTTNIIHDTVKRIGGVYIDSFQLMEPGVDPHTYRATPGDMQKLLSADLIFYNGLHLEGKMADLFNTPSFGHAHAITKALSSDLLLCTQTDCAIYDPHIWFDVKLWIMIVEYITQILTTYDTNETHCVHYRQRAQSFIHELRMLDTYLHTKACQLTHEQKILITAHDAFHYFGRAYGFHVHALQGISTDSDISTLDIQRLAQFIVDHSVRTIFIESSIAPRGLRAVQEAVKANGFETHIGPELFSDTLGPINTQTGTYIGMLRYTMDTIVDHLATSIFS